MIVSEEELKKLKAQASECDHPYGGIWQDITIEAISSILTAVFVYYVIKKHK